MPEINEEIKNLTILRVIMTDILKNFIKETESKLENYKKDLD